MKVYTVNVFNSNVSLLARDDLGVACVFGSRKEARKFSRREVKCKEGERKFNYKCELREWDTITGQFTGWAETIDRERIKVDRRKKTEPRKA